MARGFAPLIFSLVTVIAAALSHPAAVRAQGVAPAARGTELEAAYDKAFQAMLAEPGNLDRAFEFAELAARVGDFEGAIGALERMLFINPDLPRVRLELGVLYFRLGSYETARAYIQSALAAPQVPEPVRERAARFLAEIDQRVKPHKFSGGLFAGARFQSNANAAPGGTGVRVGGIEANLDERFTAKSDRNLFAAANLQHVYDLQSQSGTVIESTGSAYGSRQDRQRQVDVAVAQLASGPRLPLAILPQASIRPFLGLDYVILDDARYFWAPAIGATVRGQILPATGFELGADLRDRRYRDSAARPNNSDQDGLVTSASAQVTQQFLTFLQLSAGAGYIDEQAREGAQANHEWSFTLGAAAVFSGPIRLTDGPWTLAANVTRAFAYYDRADPTIDPNVIREDDDWRLNVTLAVPVTETLGLVATGGIFRRESTLPNFEYRNSFASLGASWKF
jgi:tetratricopeptide (TPR) repeat protein